jgi:hypothetical protein
MTRLEELEEIRRRVEVAKEMGGAENIKRQHELANRYSTFI